jgi:hypothetical protein
MLIRASAPFLHESKRNGSASMSNLSWALIRSDTLRTSGLDRNDECEADPSAATRYFDRVKFLRLGGYPLGAAIIGAWRMGKGKPVYVNFPRESPALLDEFDPPTPSQMFARLGLLLVIGLGFALVAKFLV